jgi:phage head maturation protease
VPAVLRGRNLICSLAALPLVLKDPDRTSQPSGLLGQIDPDVPNVVTLAMTLDDLIFESVSWWHVTRYDWAGFPVECKHLDVGVVSMTPPAGFPLHSLPSGIFPAGAVWVMGGPVDARDVIRFDSPNPPLKIAGARAVRRALKLAQAGEMYADDPEARAYWTPADGLTDPDKQQVKDTLREFQAARRNGSEAYIGAALKRQAADVMSPSDLTLAQLQQRCDLEIANCLGIDPEDIGVNTTSRTYANAVDRRVDQVNQTFSLYMRALTDRLSMNDVTRRGWRVQLDLTQYMQADPATRWTTYQTADRIGALSLPEIRAREDLPVSGAPARPAAAPQAPVSRETPPVPVPAGGAGMNTADPRPLHVVSFTAGGWTDLSPYVEGVSFSADGDDQAVTFTADALAAEPFRTDPARRTVGGMLLPYGPIGQNAAGKWRFAPGSVQWNRAAVSRVKLDREHDPGQLLGAATAVTGSDAGIRATFKIARTAAGDEALTLADDGALDGLSAVVKIEDYGPDPTEEGVWLVSSATLRRATLTAEPAFTDARITTVAASAAAGTGEPTVECVHCHQVHAPGTPCASGGTTFTAPAPAATAAPAGTEALTAAVTAFTAAVEALTGTIPPEQRPAPRPPVQVREPLVYSLTGQGDSFVRDAWDARNSGFGSARAEEAMARLRKYSEQTAAMQAAAVQRFANAGNTTDQAEVIPPGYRPDLYVGQVPQGRPLFDSIGTRVTLRDATSFKVPVWVGSANLSGTNSEGTGPSTGTITDHTYRTVSPTAQSGEFVITRELMDSSNPAIDVIALNAMREEYSQDTEAVIATALAAATDNDTGSGQSTEGCYVYAVTGTGNDLALKIRQMEGEFPAHRFIGPDRLLAGPTGYSALVQSVDDIGRPMFPFAGPANAMGTTGRASQSLSLDGLMVPNAWSMTSTADDAVLFNSIDMLVGESPMLTFRFEEKGGPENIYLNIWAYFAFQILRYTGIHAVNYTAA